VWLLNFLERLSLLANLQLPTELLGFWTFSIVQTMEKVQKPSNSVCYTLLSEPFRIYYCYLVSYITFRQRYHRMLRQQIQEQTGTEWTIWQLNETDFYTKIGHPVAQLVEAQCYKPDGRRFDSRWCHFIFQLI
jgi:hypothetical protein